MDLWAYQNGSEDRLLSTGQANRQRLYRDIQRRLSALSAWMPTGSTISMKQEDPLEDWRQEYNESRPHRSLGERTPSEFASQIAASRDLTELKPAGD